MRRYLRIKAEEQNTLPAAKVVLRVRASMFRGLLAGFHAKESDKLNHFLISGSVYDTTSSTQ